MLIVLFALVKLGLPDFWDVPMGAGKKQEKCGSGKIKSFRVGSFSVIIVSVSFVIGVIFICVGVFFYHYPQR